MTEPNPSDEKLRGMLCSVLAKWRSDELSFIRHRLVDFEDRIDALESRTPETNPDREERKSRLIAQAAQFAERKDQRMAMIQKAYEHMLGFVDRRERESN